MRYMQMLTALLYAAAFVVGAILLAAILGLPSLLYRKSHKSPAKFGSKTRTILAVSYIVLIIGQAILCSVMKDNEVSLFNDRSFYFPQAFVETLYQMEFSVSSILFTVITLGFASNLYILSYESYEDTNIKVLKFVSAAFYMIILHVVVALFDYLSTMLALNFFTTATVCVVAGLPVGFTVFDKTTEFLEKRSRAKGIKMVGNGIVLVCAFGGILLVKLYDKISEVFKHDRKKFFTGLFVFLLIVAAIIYIAVS